MHISSYEFKKKEIKDAYASNWPIIYIINNRFEAYIGETTNLNHRLKQHINNPIRASLSTIHMIADEKFNMSVTKDYESSLIQYMCEEYRLQNKNSGLISHHYYQKNEYDTHFSELWNQLLEKKIVNKSLIQIKNSEIFKYSPYKELSVDQYNTAMKITDLLEERDHNFILVNGEPGTGKTILAIFLCKYLADMKDCEHSSLQHLKIGFVIPMPSLRKTMKKVFRHVSGLSPDQVIGPSEVTNGYDLLIVDEGHKLKQRQNIMDYSSFDKTSRELGLDPETTDQLEWIKRNSKSQIIFYDANQKIGRSGIHLSRFETDGIELEYTVRFTLESQFRVLGGQDYIKYVRRLLTNRPIARQTFKNYEFVLFRSYHDFIAACEQKQTEVGLTRILAGYAWPWISQRDATKTDITIEGIGRCWNGKSEDWVNSKNSINEIGSIHKIQGYDLNYAGVIIGNDLKYDSKQERIVIDRNSYFDTNGKNKTNDDELFDYITNIYAVLLTRAIQGTYVYVCDAYLRNYLSQFIQCIDKKLG